MIQSLVEAVVYSSILLTGNILAACWIFGRCEPGEYWLFVLVIAIPVFAFVRIIRALIRLGLKENKP